MQKVYGIAHTSALFTPTPSPLPLSQLNSRLASFKSETTSSFEYSQSVTGVVALLPLPQRPISVGLLRAVAECQGVYLVGLRVITRQLRHRQIVVDSLYGRILRDDDGEQQAKRSSFVSDNSLKVFFSR